MAKLVKVNALATEDSGKQLVVWRIADDAQISNLPAKRVDRRDERPHGVMVAGRLRVVQRLFGLRPLAQQGHEKISIASSALSSDV